MELDKKTVRKKLIQMRLALNDEMFREQSHFIQEKLIQHPDFISAKKIGIYLSYNNEVDTWNLIEEFKERKEFYVPVVRGKEMDFVRYQEPMIKNRYGILEPEMKDVIDKQDLDLIVVPMVGYSDHGKRLGYGGGFYDRYLCDYAGKTIGIAFSLQYLQNYETEAHDIKIQSIITEK